MDWLMCLLPIAVSFVGIVAGAKLTKKRKLLFSVAAILLFVGVSVSSLMVYRFEKIIKPIQNSELLAGAELTVRPMQDKAEMNHFQTTSLTEIYQELSAYLESAIYLPCINQDTFSVSSQDVILQYGTDHEVKLWLAFYKDTNICLVNGKKAYVFPRGRAAYQEIETILATASTKTVVTVTSMDEENDLLMAEGEDGKQYAFHKVSEKLWTQEEKQTDIKTVRVGDTLTVLSDGSVLLSDPGQIENIYKIYVEG